MSDLHRREWIALAALGFAFLISATFIRANAHIDTGGRTPFIAVPATPSPGHAIPTPVVVTPTPNPVPAPSGSWHVDFITASTGKSEAILAYPTLALDFAGSPFFYMADDDWRIEATTSIQLSPGQQTLTIEHAGDVAIYVDDAEVASSSASGSARRLTAAFDHPGGSATIRIVATDTAGPFVLRWITE